MLSPGDTFDRYRIEEKLGEGGMGLVFCAYDTMLRRRIALKILRPEVARSEDGTLTEAAHRLMREGRAAASINHPNAIGIFDVGEIQGTPYIAMELVRGRPLHQFVGDLRVSMKRRIIWLAHVARGLDAAHRRGLVHRDVKPENVMICEDGSVKILDFGVVKRVHQDLTGPIQMNQLGVPEFKTMAGVVVGTPLYMAPEQVIGDVVDGRSDQFAWGTMAYELLSGGTHPATTNNPRNLAVAYAVLQEKPQRLGELVKDVPAAVETVVMRTLAKSPDSRFLSMEEVFLALDAVVADLSEGDDDPTGADSSPTVEIRAPKGESIRPGGLSERPGPGSNAPPGLPILPAAGMQRRRSGVGRSIAMFLIPLVLSVAAFMIGRYLLRR
jgi:serine/threonine protein kinase